MTLSCINRLLIFKYWMYLYVHGYNTNSFSAGDKSYSQMQMIKTSLGHKLEFIQDHVTKTNISEAYLTESSC